MLEKIPIIGSIAASLKRIIAPSAKFTNSEEYWINRYEKGGNSGAGSYNKLAEFKGEVINDFVSKKEIKTVIELGCGDGNQLNYFKFPSYIGFDISDYIIERCKAKYKEDNSKQFFHINEVSNHRADMVMSLDVIYHLIEEDIYQHYMERLFDQSNKYVLIYAIDDIDEPGKYVPHVKPRKFSSWIEENRSDFKLIKHIPNKYPYKRRKAESTSFADFYIYEKVD